jgi:pyruvate,water dikinase
MLGSSTKWIYWLDELTKEHDNLVGKKCANLGELTRAGFRVPTGFALSLDAYDRFMRESGALEEQKISELLQRRP